MDCAGIIYEDKLLTVQVEDEHSLKLLEEKITHGRTLPPTDAWGPFVLFTEHLTDGEAEVIRKLLYLEGEQVERLFQYPFVVFRYA